MKEEYDVAVVGAGVNGLMTAYHLSKNHNLRILLLEQFEFGHQNGSSHSQIRIIRSTYKDPLYVQLALLAKNIHWPQLEADLGTRFIHNNPFLIFGDYLPAFNEYKAPLGTKGFENLKIISGEQAQSKYPELKLKHLKQVIEDTNAGVVLAQKAMNAVYKYLTTRPNVTIKTNTKLVTYTSQDNKVSLSIESNGSKSTLTTNKLLLTVGRWVKDLLPQFQQYFTIHEQLISFFELNASIENISVGKFPCWLSFDGSQTQFYGLPAFGTDALKFGRHTTIQPNDKQTKEQKAAEMKSFGSKIFNKEIKNVQKYQSCYYTSTASEDFIIEFIDKQRNVLLGSICSGHAFKFGPLTGLILSELLQQGKSRVGVFQKNRHQFSTEYLRSGGRPKL